MRLLVVVTLVAAIGATPASSAQRTESGHAKVVKRAAKRAPLTLAVSLAERYWGVVPCAGQIEIRTGQAIPAGLGADSDAWVTFDTPLGANDLTASSRDYSSCKIALAGTRWPDRISMTQDWDLLCMTMIHEYGHLLGRTHDATMGGVMTPIFTNYRAEPQLCRANRPAPR